MKTIGQAVKLLAIEKIIFAENAKFCSNCGESFEKTEDYYLSDAKRKMAVLKTKRTKLLKTVNGDNFRRVSKEADELDEYRRTHS